MPTSIVVFIMSFTCGGKRKSIQSLLWLGPTIPWAQYGAGRYLLEERHFVRQDEPRLGCRERILEPCHDVAVVEDFPAAREHKAPLQAMYPDPLYRAAQRQRTPE